MEATTLLQAYQNKNLKSVQFILSTISSEQDYEELSTFLTAEQIDLARRLQSLIYNEDSVEAENFKGLRFLHDNFEVKMLNTLPVHFSAIRDKIAFTIATAGRDLEKSNLPLSIALLSYTRKVKVENKKLKEQIDWLLDKKRFQKRQQHISAERGSRKKRNKTYAGLALTIISLIFVGIRLVRMYANWQNQDDFTETFEQERPVKNQRTYVPKTRAGEEAKWFQSERTLAARFEYGDKYTNELKGRGNVAAELKDKGFLFGNNPMECFQTSIFNGLRPTKSIVIHGDKKRDAILFLQWGNRIGRQIFIPKKTSFYVFVNKNQELTASVIFGNDWDDNLDNPCGGKGFFSKDVIYAPAHSHATIPRDLNTKEKLLKMRLRHNKLLPAEKTTQDHFMRILADYSD